MNLFRARDDPTGLVPDALHSCMVTHYPGEQGVGYHTDFELSLEDGAPIVVLSLGEPRRVDFNWYSADLRGTPKSNHVDYSRMATLTDQLRRERREGSATFEIE